MKFVTFAATPSGQSTRSFQDWFGKEYAPAIVTHAPALVGGVVRRRIEPPDASYLQGIAADTADGILPYDVVLETWLPSSEDFRREILPLEKRLSEMGARYISYAVVPHLRKDPRIAEAGPAGKRPEVTYIISLKWKPTITAEVGAREWGRHTPVCLRAQKAITKYEQNIVTKAISWTPGTPAVHGFGDFSFRTMSDFVDGFRVTQEETQDTSSYVGMFHVAFLGDAMPL